MLEKLISVAGLVVFLAIGLALCTERKHINWRLIGWGLGLQFVFAFLILKTWPGLVAFDAARAAMTSLLDFSDIGSRFFFGNLVSDPNIGAIFAFKVLPAPRHNLRFIPHGRPLSPRHHTGCSARDGVGHGKDDEGLLAGSGL